jgi:hypothetical protein
MKTGITSEILILSGAYLFSASFYVAGIVLLSLGCIGAAVRFFYDVSNKNSILEFKLLMYSDIKSFLKNAVSLVISGAPINEQPDKKHTIH